MAFPFLLHLLQKQAQLLFFEQIVQYFGLFSSFFFLCFNGNGLKTVKTDEQLDQYIDRLSARPNISIDYLQTIDRC